jgi:ABC-type multidrug transport system fused ATPase/permease subunit
MTTYHSTPFRSMPCHQMCLTLNFTLPFHFSIYDVTLIDQIFECYYYANNNILYAYSISTRVLPYMQRYYSASARELARLTGICQASVIQHFSETISGSTTIRSFEQESRFHEMNMQLIDKYSQPKLYSGSAMEWLKFRLDLLSSIVFAFCLVFLVSFPSSIADPSE